MVGVGLKQPYPTVSLLPFDYYLLKFCCDMFCRAELELTYYELACSAGITMMPSKLYTDEGITIS